VRGLRWACALLLLAGAWRVGEAQGRWRLPGWRCRRTVAAIPLRVPYQGSDVAYFELYGQGHLKPDASDIRVMALGKPLRHKVLYVSPTGIARILFELMPDTEEYEIYYGNPEAPAPKDDFQPRRGLILETRRYAGGNINNWAQARRALQRSGPPFGAGPVDRVFHGHNPFGPSARFVSVYEGWLNCPIAGTYGFATTSGNASFLFLNDELVVDWPGRHGPVADARHHRNVVLAKGLAKLRYVAFYLGGRPTSVAAWKLPGSSRYEVIPSSAFPPIVKATAKLLEINGQRIAPDFRITYAGQATLTPEADRYLVKVQFLNTSGPATRLNYRMLWDFGDGITSSLTSPTHVYAAPGTYKVTLRIVAGATYEATQAVEIEQDWDAQVARRIDDRADYYDELRRYGFSNMPAKSLGNLVDYFLAVGQPTDALRAGRSLLLGRTNAPDELLLKAAHALGKSLLPDRRTPGTHRDPEEALALYSAAEGKAHSAAAKAQMALAQGTVLFEELRDLQKAREAHERVLQTYRMPGSSAEARRAYIGLGNVERWQGNLAAARQWYEKARAVPLGDQKPEQLIVRRSAWARAVEDALSRNDAEVTELAWHDLAAWAWYFPEDLLQGHHTLLLGKLLLGERNPQRAAEELEALLRVNPESQYADQALWLLADAYHVLREPEKALEALDRLQRHYPASGLIPRVEERRRRLRSTPGA